MNSIELWNGFSNLLIPVDLTSNSDRVLGRLALLPLVDAPRITLLHVLPGDLELEVRHRAELDARKALAEEALHLAKSLPEQARLVQTVTHGAAAAEIAKCGTETGAEMIVMGRGGGHSLRDAFLGSTAERVVRRTRLPVLVVRTPARAGYERPALALNDDEAAGVALAQMLKVVPGRQPHVTVIHAYEAPYQRFMRPAIAEEDGSDVEYAGQIQPEAARKVGEVLTSALAAANVAAVDAPIWTNHVRMGAPRFVISKAVTRYDTDLLVMGTRGNSGLAFAFLGTVAGDVLRAVNCDVLVVPPANDTASS